MAKPVLSINLLGNPGEPFLDKFVRWALSAGRTIVILTEVIALSAFIYRFTIDRRIVDLNDEIEQKQLIVGQYEEREAIFRNLQARLASAKKLEENTNTTQLLNDIITLATGRLRFNTLEITESQIKIDGTTSSTTQLNYFISQLRQQPKIERISLDKLDNRTSQGTIEVAITAYLEVPKVANTKGKNNTKEASL